MGSWHYVESTALGLTVAVLVEIRIYKDNLDRELSTLIMNSTDLNEGDVRRLGSHFCTLVIRQATS